MQEKAPTYKIEVHPPKIKPAFTTIGYGNPRYNSMVVYKHGVLLTVGSRLRWVDIKNSQVLYDEQIGCCQIFQLMENTSHILVVNFDGLITLLSKEDLSLVHQFSAPGKEIRHSAFTDSYIAVSCELNQGD